MKLPTNALSLLALAIALVVTTSRAEAQVIDSTIPRNDRGAGVTYSPASTVHDSYTAPYGTSGSYSTSRFPSYSYWTAAYYGFPPRIYAGYGSNDFPYHGRPYGSPSDPWSWPAMSR